VIVGDFAVSSATEKETGRRIISLEKRGYWPSDHEKQL
jgi:hypothetical protein